MLTCACCGILSRLQGNTCSSIFFFLWAAEECLLWYLEHLLYWSWLCCGFSLPALLPMPCDILPFKFAFSGTASLADGLVLGLQWLWYGTSSVQHRATPDFSWRPPLQLLPKLCHVSPIQVVRQDSILWVSIAASAMLHWNCKAPSRVSNGFTMLPKVLPT